MNDCLGLTMTNEVGSLLSRFSSTFTKWSVVQYPGGIYMSQYRAAFFAGKSVLSTIAQRLHTETA